MIQIIKITRHFSTSFYVIFIVNLRQEIIRSKNKCPTLAKTVWSERIYILAVKYFSRLWITRQTVTLNTALQFDALRAHTSGKKFH